MKITKKIVKTKKMVYILIAAVIVVVYAASHISKFDIGLFYLPKSYVLYCMNNNLKEEWRKLQSVYNSSYCVRMTALKEEKELLSLTVYNDKDKIIFSSPRLFDNDYFGLAKNKGGQSNKSPAKNKKENLSLTEIYEKYAKVSKGDRKSFAVTGGKKSMCETKEYEVVLDKNIKEVIPDYLKKYIGDKTLLKKIKACFSKLDSDITVDIYVDNSDKIRSIALSCTWGGQEVYGEITFNDAADYWNDISVTYILEGKDKTTVTVKSKGNHICEGNVYSDETDIIVFDRAVTTVQLKISTSIDFNKGQDNVSFELEGDIYSLPVHAEAVGDLNTGTKTQLQMDINLELKYMDYLLKINMDEEENNLKNVDSFHSISGLYEKEKSRSDTYLEAILQIINITSK